jgi:site-specific DNA-methyltransferase (adenine-specific)
MNIAEFVNTLSARGVVFSTKNGRLKWRDPNQAITAMARQFLRKLKAEIIVYLTQRTLNPVVVDPQALLDSLTNRVLHSHNESILLQLPDNSIDAFISDPPYGIDLLGKHWDESVPKVKFWRHIHRVMKPGGFVIVLSAPRQDVLANNLAALRKAGFDVGFSSLYWTYATGFPKAKNMSASIDKKLGVEREIIGMRPGLPDFKASGASVLGFMVDPQKPLAYTDVPITTSESDEAKAFDGSYAGYQPKPAVEVVIVAMKPKSERSYTSQALVNGKGVVWFNDARIPFAHGEAIPTRDLICQPSSSSGQVIGSLGEEWQANNNGRFPANLLVSDGVLGEHSKYFDLDRWEEEFIKRLPPECQGAYPYLVVAKPSQKEKRVGLPEGMKNTNPCVKPIKLMAYLVTMFSRPGDLILDPFAGSGTTLIAAKMLGRNFIGIEQSAEYHAIAAARVNHAGTDDPYLRDIIKSAKVADDAADIAVMGKPPVGFFSNVPPLAATACSDNDGSGEEGGEIEEAA